MYITIPKQKVYINECKIKQTKTGANYYQFYTSLGKNKGTITCKCYDTRHDLTKLLFIDRVAGDLTRWKNDKGAYMYELKILDFAEPKVADWRVDKTLPVKKLKVETQPEEIPSLEDFNEMEKE